MNKFDTYINKLKSLDRDYVTLQEIADIQNNVLGFVRLFCNSNNILKSEFYQMLDEKKLKKSNVIDELESLKSDK